MLLFLALCSSLQSFTNTFVMKEKQPQLTSTVPNIFFLTYLLLNSRACIYFMKDSWFVSLHLVHRGSIHMSCVAHKQHTQACQLKDVCHTKLRLYFRYRRQQHFLSQKSGEKKCYSSTKLAYCWVETKKYSHFLFSQLFSRQ